MTADTADGSPPRPRRRRGAAESLGSIVLAAESLVVFLGGLLVYGLSALPDGIPAWWGIVAGAVLAVLMLLIGRTLQYRWGIVLGWVLQALVLAGALLVPAFALVALIFGGLWAYATIKGASLDARNARLAQQEPTPDGD